MVNSKLNLPFTIRFFYLINYGAKRLIFQAPFSKS